MWSLAILSEQERLLMHSLRLRAVFMAIGILATACVQKTEPPDNRVVSQSQLDDILVQHPMFSGSVIVAQNGQITACAHTGFANRESGLMNNAETLHSVASVGKMFTAVAIVQLFEAKRLGFATPVSKIIPEFAGRINDSVTVDHLLHHTSGLEQIADVDDATLDALKDNADYFELVISTGIGSKGPAEFEYNNSNFQILGEIVERISHQSYNSYIREYIADPAGMTGPIFTRKDRSGNLPLAENYLAVDFETWWNSEESIVASDVDEFVHTAPAATPSAGGGSYATALDMILFATALRDGTLISVKSFNEMCSLGSGEGAPVRGYGRGCSFDVGEQGARVGHTGSSAGIQARFFIYREQGLDVVVLSNHDEQAAPVFGAIDKLIRGR
jgi:CubicO group peptidase (beta-lactamase class C family)